MMFRAYEFSNQLDSYPVELFSTHDATPQTNMETPISHDIGICNMDLYDETSGEENSSCPERHGNITTEHNEEIIRMDKTSQSTAKTEWKTNYVDMILRGSVKKHGCTLGRTEEFLVNNAEAACLQWHETLKQKNEKFIMIAENSVAFTYVTTVSKLS